MPDQDRERGAVTGRARIVEPPRPEWEGLFVEPELPPVVEDDDA